MTDRSPQIVRQYKPYPLYKKSGIEWLGDIPTAWELRRLKATITDCQNGVWGDEPDGLYDIPCIRVADFDRGAFRVHIADLTLRSIASDIVKGRGLHSGDLLLEKSGGGENQPVGVVVIYDHTIPAVSSNFIARMKVTAGYNPRFLSYLHAALYALRINIKHIKQSTGIQNLDSDSYLSETIGFPNLNEQHAIAAFLDRETERIDALVAKKERLIQLLEEERAAVITLAVTSGLDPHVPMKDSGVEWLGEIPAHWEVLRLGRLASVGNGSTPNRENPEFWVDGSYPWLTSGKINEEIIVVADEFVTPSALRKCNLPIVRAGSLLVAITGEGQTRGRVALLRIESAISQHLAFVTPKTDRLQAVYLRRFLQARYDWLRQESSGAGSTRAALTCEFLKAMLIAFPPKKVQSEIAIFLDRDTARIDTLISKVREAIVHLNELRTALISAAVTGKIDVRESA